MIANVVVSFYSFAPVRLRANCTKNKHKVVKLISLNLQRRYSKSCRSDPKAAPLQELWPCQACVLRNQSSQARRGRACFCHRKGTQASTFSRGTVCSCSP